MGNTIRIWTVEKDVENSGRSRVLLVGWAVEKFVGNLARILG